MGDLETLNGAARAVDEARRACASAVMHQRHAFSLQARAGTAFDGAAAKSLDMVEVFAQTGGDAANQAFALLLSLGAERPGRAIPRDKVPLELLDTPAARELLAALDAVVVAARRVDRERGWVDDDGVGIGFEETFAAHRLQLQTEIFGPVGSADATGARE